MRNRNTSDRTWHRVHAPSFEAVTRSLVAPPTQFVLFVAADASELTDLELRAFAKTMIDTGARYTCCWGPHCERVHDAFDAERDEAEPRTGGLIMTTWHNDESLEDAAWYAAHTAIPAEPFDQTCRAVIFATVGNAEWSDRLAAYLDAGAPIFDEA